MYILLNSFRKMKKNTNRITNIEEKMKSEKKLKSEKRKDGNEKYVAICTKIMSAPEIFFTML